MREWNRVILKASSISKFYIFILHTSWILDNLTVVFGNDTDLRDTKMTFLLKNIK